jgi:hypothetical protein
MATVEAFLQASNCPEFTKNAWLFLKKNLLELSITQNTRTSTTEDKILKKLSDIEKKISAPPAFPQKPSTHANTARLALTHSAQRKPVPSGALNEVLVKVVDDTKPSQTSGKLVESINAAHSSKAGKVLAAWKLDSGDSVITADSYETKNLIEHEEGWTKVIAGKTKVKGRRFRVIVHAVRTNRIETANQEKALAELQAQNLQLKDRVKYLKLTWKQKTLKAGKRHGPLLLDVGTPEEANTLVLEGLFHDHKLKN